MGIHVRNEVHCSLGKLDWDLGSIMGMSSCQDGTGQQADSVWAGMKNRKFVHNPSQSDLKTRVVMAEQTSAGTMHVAVLVRVRTGRCSVRVAATAAIH